MATLSLVRLSNLVEMRLDPEYYQGENIALAAVLDKANPRSVATFADVTDGIHGSPDFVDKDGITYLSAKCVKDNYFILTDAGMISVKQNRQNMRTQARLNDVLLSTVGTIGNAAVVYEGILPANMDRHLGIIRIRENMEIDPYYLATFLNSKFGRFQTLREATGNVQLNLFIDKIKKLLVPINERFNKVGRITRKAYQKRLEAEALFAQAADLLLLELKLDKVDTSHQTVYSGTLGDSLVSRRLDAEYFQPKYARMVTHLSTNWPTENIGQWTKVLKGKSVNHYTQQGIPVIRSGDLSDLDELEDLKYASPNEDLFYLCYGDVCVSSIGFGSIGKIQVFDKSERFATVSEVTVIRQNKVNPYYLQLFLQSPAGQLQIEKYITGATGQLHLYPKDVEHIVVPILSSTLQEDLEKILIRARDLKKEAKYLTEQANMQLEEMIMNMLTPQVSETNLAQAI